MTPLRLGMLIALVTVPGLVVLALTAVGGAPARTVTWSIVSIETIRKTACRLNTPNCQIAVGLAIMRTHGRCTILTPPPTKSTLWIIQHELRHCAGWTHK